MNEFEKSIQSSISDVIKESVKNQLSRIPPGWKTDYNISFSIGNELPYVAFIAQIEFPIEKIKLYLNDMKITSENIDEEPSYVFEKRIQRVLNDEKIIVEAGWQKGSVIIYAESHKQIQYVTKRLKQEGLFPKEE